MDAPQWPKVSEHGYRKDTGLNNLAEGSVDISVSNSSSSRLTNKKARPNKEQALNCPRCNSTNTKFCYYNNYNPSQPRHLCKACRRYWTHGGTLRNVPVGGTSRKKIIKPSLGPDFQSSQNRLFLDLNPKPTTTVSLNQDLNMGLYYANAQHHFLPNPSLFEFSRSQGALSPYQNASMGFNFQDIVQPTLNLSMDGGFGSTNHSRSNMEGEGRNPINLFGEVKQVSATAGEENAINQTNGQMRESENGVVYWNQMHHGLYN